MSLLQGLDPLIQNKLYDVLRAENKRGTTIFFSSHVLSEIQKMCDQVAIVKEGRILKIDSVENCEKFIQNDSN
jgi:ABC-2 type transport system ATP-binding protein